MRFRRDLFRDEEGVTTVGMVVALLVTLALIFSSAQVYRASSASAEIQEVADVAALAAENEVAEFMVAVRVCDALVLSLTLLSASVYGLGAAALCVPAAASVGVQLVELGGKVLEARNAFADKAARGLDALQKALPFLAAANASSVAVANNANAADASYLAVAMLVPAQGDPITVGAEPSLEDLGSSITESAEDVKRAAAEAEAAAQAANEAKLRAFEHDCGSNPAYCMYERAGRLAGLSANANPLYQSVDAWSFSVALNRARAYYAARLANEAPRSGSVEEQANSALRKRFYAYAVEQLSFGYVVDTSDSFEAYFPHLFRNTDQMRGTSLYDEAVYPVTEEAGSRVMHAWSGCPQASGAAFSGSLRELDAGGFDTCPSCRFTVSSLGNVAAASTSISNGFEYHYEAVARACEDYASARAQLDPKASYVKGQVGSLLETCAEVVLQAGNKRIEATPPGSKGAVSLVVNVASSPADAGFESSFVAGGQTLGARAAVSGATLVADASHDGATVISSLLDGFGRDGGGAVGAVRIVLDCWSSLLGAFSKGQEALVGAVEQALGSLPLVGPSGLGSWAAGKLRDSLDAVGLAPAQLDALKPVLVNTGHVTAAGDDAFSASFATAKQRALSASSPSTSLFVALVDGVESSVLDHVERLEDGVVVATVEFPAAGLSFPVTLALPPAVSQGAAGFVEQCAEVVRSFAGSLSSVRSWS